ncbi:3D (Asp-Asp-Asp) domain-containing protein [Maribacter vaceletii]|uniref:3D (Asp-Asp-Asp) domain-containing protein n=1 Tax=Maribacter vaceletii TaxID=1206816 RepID=A0A495E8W7_9FLAO|nr:3D domain-containing protein [Maribacter vaceletii]RKR13019.1 3D (Asp-Asp-Asp) domain-containing protein [Maribacter vaceletii]
MSFYSKITGLSIFIFLVISCKKAPNKEEYIWKPFEVTATAYNSLASQTSSTPNITAWGDTLVPGMKCVAVSRNLISLGITHNTQIKIEGLEGVYIVNDKMNKKWRNRIDIYMGVDVVKAKEWGKRKKKIYYRVKKDSLNTKSKQ